MRITNKDLEAVVRRLNLITNSPTEAYSMITKGDNLGKYKANIGSYHLSYAHGGVCLHRMDNESGGVTTPINSGHVSKRELYGLMQAYIQGILNTQKEN